MNSWYVIHVILICGSYNMVIANVDFFFLSHHLIDIRMKYEWKWFRSIHKETTYREKNRCIFHLARQIRNIQGMVKRESVSCGRWWYMPVVFAAVIQHSKLKIFSNNNNELYNCELCMQYAQSTKAGQIFTCALPWMKSGWYVVKHPCNNE